MVTKILDSKIPFFGQLWPILAQFFALLLLFGIALILIYNKLQAIQP
jgi:hypothetical protein